ncbi:hypothetical protein [Pseudomonas sp. CLCA07]
MNTANWNDLLPNHEAIQAMTPEKLKTAECATGQYVATLAFGISGIDNFLVCTASNGVSGLDEGAVTSVGWFLENQGALVGNISDTGSAVTCRNNEIERGGV